MIVPATSNNTAPVPVPAVVQKRVDIFANKKQGTTPIQSTEVEKTASPPKDTSPSAKQDALLSALTTNKSQPLSPPIQMSILSTTVGDTPEKVQVVHSLADLESAILPVELAADAPNAVTEGAVHHVSTAYDTATIAILILFIFSGRAANPASRTS